MNLKTLFSFFLASIWSLLCQGQNNDELLKSYFVATRHINTVSYNVQRIDTFTTGDVWNNKGICTLQRDDLDSLFGFHFYGARADIHEKALYDGHRMFNIFDSAKNYSTVDKPGTWILGSPGGQMVVTEFFGPGKNYSSIGAYHEGTNEVIRIDYADDTADNVSQRYVNIYLDHATMLPVKIVKSLFSLNRKQVQIYLLSNIKIDDANNKSLADKNFLSDYTMLPPEQKPVANLMGKKAQLFSLQSFNGKLISMNAFQGKVILLDFWETWCSPCVKSLPLVQALHEKYGQKGLTVMGIMCEEKSLESAKILVEKKGISFFDLVGNSEVQKAYHVTGVPKYILIDETGKIIYESLYGYEEKLEQMIKEKFNF